MRKKKNINSIEYLSKNNRKKENKHYNELKSSTGTKMFEFEGYVFLHVHNKFSKLFHKNLRFITEIMSESNNTEN